MRYLIIFLFLFSCSDTKNYPTGAFGVEIGEDIAKYFSEKDLGVIEKIKKDKTYADNKYYIINSEIDPIKFTPNSNFYNFYFYVSQKDDKVMGAGGTKMFTEYKARFINECSENRYNLLNQLSRLYKINRNNFDENYQIDKEEEVYNELLSLKYKKNNIDYDLRIKCQYRYLTNGSGIMQELIYSINQITSKPQKVTDKKLIDKLNTRYITLDKPLSNEAIKQDFRGY